MSVDGINAALNLHPRRIIFRYTCAVCGKESDVTTGPLFVGMEVWLGDRPAGWRILRDVGCAVCPDHKIEQIHRIDGKEGTFQTGYIGYGSDFPKWVPE